MPRWRHCSPDEHEASGRGNGRDAASANGAPGDSAEPLPQVGPPISAGSTVLAVHGSARVEVDGLSSSDRSGAAASTELGKSVVRRLLQS